MKQNNYKEELQNRTIDPSSDAWERLQIKLDSQKNKEKGKKWPFIKYAAAVLILISVSLYISESNKEVINDPEIVMPSPKKDLNSIEKITMDPEAEVEVAASPGISNSKQPIQTAQGAFPSTKDASGKEEVALADTHNETGISAIQVTEKDVHDTLSQAYVQAEALPFEEKTLEDEVAQLLSQSKIKLNLNDQISSKKTVSAHSLLNEVEDDLDKALKQKLFEKITNTIKNPKAVVTFQEN